MLVAAAHVLDEIERAKAHHITIGKPSLDWGALIDRDKAMIAGIRPSLGELMGRRGVEVIRDHGRFAGPNTVAVGGETLEAKHIVIATGSSAGTSSTARSTCPITGAPPSPAGFEIQRKTRKSPAKHPTGTENGSLDQYITSGFAMPKNNERGIADQRKEHSSTGAKTTTADRVLTPKPEWSPRGR